MVLLYSYIPARLFLLKMYFGTLFCNELMFLCHTLPYGIPPNMWSRIYTGWQVYIIEGVAWARRALNIASLVLFLVEQYAPAGWTLGVSALLWFSMYVIVDKIPFKLKSSDANYVYNAWSLAHVGAINWVFDVPGNGCKRTKVSHVLIILLNIAAGVAVTLGVFIAPTLAEAWGCYGKSATIADLNAGPCASYFNICPYDKDTHCPDFSVPACLLPSTTVNCGADTLDASVATEFKPFATAGFAILAASLALYVITFDLKYNTLLKQN